MGLELEVEISVKTHEVGGRFIRACNSKWLNLKNSNQVEQNFSKKIVNRSKKQIKPLIKN